MLPPSQTPGVYAIEVPSSTMPIAGVSTSTAGFIGLSVTLDTTAKYLDDGTGTNTPLKVNGNPVTVQDAQYLMPLKPGTSNTYYTQAAALQPQLITSWVEFTQKFGLYPFLTQKLPAKILTQNTAPPVEDGGDGGNASPTYTSVDYPTYIANTYGVDQYLAQAVMGFFNNGGTRCWVCRINGLTTNFTTDMTNALGQFKLIDDTIALMAAPMPPGTSADGTPNTGTNVMTPTFLHNNVHVPLIGYCEGQTNCVAILDSDRDVKAFTPSTDATGIWEPTSTEGYGAFYFPWLTVTDPLNTGATVAVPPSGHLAGLFARVDAQRGVFKAPANETLRGTAGLRYLVSDSQQTGLNPKGINVIRSFSGAVTVWGARTLASNTAAGGDPEWTYLNVRRTLIYIRTSLVQGTRWAVFEPNDASLWARLTRSVTDFLTTFWRAGGLFGATPDQAFFVRCDETTNTPDVRAQGMVIIQVGVSVVTPSEFVIFQISQGPTLPGS